MSPLTVLLGSGEARREGKCNGNEPSAGFVGPFKTSGSNTEAHLSPDCVWSLLHFLLCRGTASLSLVQKELARAKGARATAAYPGPRLRPRLVLWKTRETL